MKNTDSFGTYLRNFKMLFLVITFPLWTLLKLAIKLGYYSSLKLLE